MNFTITNRGAKELDRKENYEASGVSRVTLERPWTRENDKGSISTYQLAPYIKLETVGTNTYRVIA